MLLQVTILLDGEKCPCSFPPAVLEIDQLEFEGKKINLPDLGSIKLIKLFLGAQI